MHQTRLWGFGYGNLLALSLLVACGSGESGAGDEPSMPGDSAANGDGGAGSDNPPSGGAKGGEEQKDAGVAAGGAGGANATGGVANAGSSSATLPLAANAIASTITSTCALDSLGHIRCWGGYDGGILEPPEGEFLALSASDSAMCGLRASDGIAMCFTYTGNLEEFSHFPDFPVRSIAPSGGFVCGIDVAGETFCRWANASFALDTPTDETFAEISTGAAFACGISMVDGTLLCWGSEGGEDSTCPPSVGRLDFPSGQFKQLFIRNFTGCAVGLDGSLACWGAGTAEDDPAQEGCGELLNFGQAAPPAGTFVDVRVSNYHSCGIRTDGTVACWGAGTDPELCEGKDCRQSIPPAGEFEQLALGFYHTCAMRSDRSVECWGYDGEAHQRTTPPPEFQ